MSDGLTAEPAKPDDKAGWSRFRPCVELSLAQASRLLAPCALGHPVERIELLRGGLSNTNYRVHLQGTDRSVVLRLYGRDPGACRKEADLHRLAGPEVPVPEVLHVEPRGAEGLPPFAVLDHVDGILFRTLKAGRDPVAVGQASHAVGRCLARIGRHRFPRPGTIGPGLEVGPWLLDGPDVIPRLVDLCLASAHLQRHVGPELAGLIHAFAWGWAARLSALDAESSLVHADFNSPNILVKPMNGRWEVAAILDWEFAFSGSPLWDAGNFLRYERRERPLREPWFSRGCEEGGMALPEDWRRLARAVDLTSLCEILTRDPLPPDVPPEIVELVKATLEDRDPAL
jgi:aminoglycoside phosphotransferase (APT) family kinase protein